MPDVREQETIRVIKADGTHVPFNPDKIRESLRRAGASDVLKELQLSASKMRSVMTEAHLLCEATEDGHHRRQGTASEVATPSESDNA